MDVAPLYDVENAKVCQCGRLGSPNERSTAGAAGETPAAAGSLGSNGHSFGGGSGGFTVSPSAATNNLRHGVARIR
jgi:hypothetical protein